MSFSVDGNGDRIKSHILVAGFVHKSVEENNIAIPDELIAKVSGIPETGIPEEFSGILAFLNSNNGSF